MACQQSEEPISSGKAKAQKSTRTAPVKRPPQDLLHPCIARNVQTGRRLVQHEDLALAQECASEREELPLAPAEVPAVAGDKRLELLWQRLDQRLALRLLERRPELLVRTRPFEIEVLANRQLQQERVCGGGQESALCSLR